MLATKNETQTYLSAFEDLEKRGSDPAWLRPIRKAAIASFAELGFPTTRHEDWKYTDVAPIARTAFLPAYRGGGSPAVDPPDLAVFDFGGAGGHRLVFVNGRYNSPLSDVGTLPRGVTVGHLANAIASDQETVKKHLARHAAYNAHPFTALNTALFEDGALIALPRGVLVDQPIHVVFLSTPGAEPTVTHPRLLLVAGANSQATIVETHAGLGSGVYFANAVTEIVAGEGAVLDHYKIGREDETAYHVGDLHVNQRRSSHVTSHVVTLGGALVRNNMHAFMDDEGCECTLNGLSVLGGTQHVDNHLRVEHTKPHCNSREYFKNVLDDHSRGVFRGRIVVHEGAQKTDAKQTSMTLLLSENAQAESRPQLEIFADDVRCTHGATIGQVDDEAIFYLRSRGIEPEAARSLLVYAFASESLGQIRVAPLRNQLEQLLFERLPRGDLIRDKGRAQR